MYARYRIVYYLSPSGDKPFERFLDSLEKRPQVKVIRVFQSIKEFGIDAVKKTRKLKGTPLWEIRIIGKDNIRVIYVVPSARMVLVLHGFVKKKQKTPVKEINTALARYREWQKRAVEK